jgi:hypothetical protein
MYDWIVLFPLTCGTAPTGVALGDRLWLLGRAHHTGAPGSDDG